MGSGPNGLTAAVTLAGAGWRVLVVEAAPTIGGGTRSAALTRPGFVHDVCSTVHPLGVGSPALRALPLAEHGVEWLQPELPVVHPLNGGQAAVLARSVETTAAGLGADEGAYRSLMAPLARHGLDLVDGLLAPTTLPPAHPVALARFGWPGVRSARGLARARFEGTEARALLAGLSAHSFLPLDRPITAGFGLTLGLLGHVTGWPVARGGSHTITDALAALLLERGGEIVVDQRVFSLRDLPPSRAVLLDVSPRQALAIAGDRFSGRYRRALQRFRYGPGAFKVDWALDGPIPWTAPAATRTATVHVGGTFEEVAAAEAQVAEGRHPERPFVLVAQQSVVDDTRAPAGQQTGWAYCHVPSGSTVDMTDRIEAQVERFAPGFRDRILARHVLSPRDLQSYNGNYIGGDINSGSADLRQFVARPVASLHPWRTSAEGVYLCSSSTPPGGGVHGMCGWNAAQTVLRDHP